MANVFLKICKLNVHLTPKIFFRLNNSLHMFETRYAVLPLLNPNPDFLQAVKVTKSGHDLFHHRASNEAWAYSGFHVTNFFACMITKTYYDQST